MVFRKNNKLGAKKFLTRPLDDQPVTFKAYRGNKEALKNVPNWQERLRNYVERLIDESNLEGD